MEFWNYPQIKASINESFDMHSPSNAKILNNKSDHNFASNKAAKSNYQEDIPLNQANKMIEIGILIRVRLWKPGLGEDSLCRSSHWN